MHASRALSDAADSAKRQLIGMLGESLPVKFMREAKSDVPFGSKRVILGLSNIPSNNTLCDSFGTEYCSGVSILPILNESDYWTKFLKVKAFRECMVRLPCLVVSHRESVAFNSSTPVHGMVLIEIRESIVSSKTKVCLSSIKNNIVTSGNLALIRRRRILIITAHFT